ncbi:MAG: hypothetical protein ABIH41_02310 [Nanoarchaeota archaeon]
MKSTLRRAKNSKKEIYQFAQAYRRLTGRDPCEATPNDVIDRDVITTDDLYTIRNDGREAQSIPAALLTSDLRADRLLVATQALLQPTGTQNPKTGTIALAYVIEDVVRRWTQTGRRPNVCKAVSYFSELQRGKSEEVNPCEKISTFDLLAMGRRYVDTMGSEAAFTVIGTMNYELWNRLSSEETATMLGDLRSGSAGTQLVERYLETLQEPRYAYLRENIALRERYLRAMADLVGAAYVPIDDIMATERYQEELTRFLELPGDEQGAWLYEGDTQARNFAGFVVAEEAALYECGNDICLGPLQEDIPLNAAVATIQTRMRTEPALLPVWYNRPAQMPRLTVDATPDVIRQTLSDERNSNYREYIGELMDKSGYARRTGSDTRDLGALVETTIAFCADVNRMYEAQE